MGEFNSEDHYIYYCGQGSYRRNGVGLIINKSPKCSTWVQPQKWQNDLSLFSRHTIQHHRNSSLCPYYQCQRSWSVLQRARRPPRTNTNKRCSIHYWGLGCKSRKSRETWSNRQLWPWRTKWSWAEANWILPRERTGHSKHPFSTTQEMTLHMDITKWSIQKSDWLHPLKPRMEKLYIATKNKTWSWLWLRSLAPHSQLQA